MVMEKWAGKTCGEMLVEGRAFFVFKMIIALSFVNSLNHPTHSKYDSSTEKQT